jgi:hypothetical protein
MKPILTLALLILPLPAWGQDALDTPAWRASMRHLDQLDRDTVAQWSREPGWPFWVWKYLHAVHLEETGQDASGAYGDAIAAADELLSFGPSGNYSHNPHYGPLAYMRLKHKLTPATEAKWRATLESWAQNALGLTSGNKLMLSDSDKVIGSRSLVRLVDMALGTSYATQKVWWTTDGSGTPDVWVTVPAMEATIETMLDVARGGEWFTGTQYGMQESREIVFFGLLTGIDNHPRIKSFARDAAENYRWHHTPDLNDVAQWGDEQHGHDLQRHYRAPLYYVLAAAGGDPDGHLTNLAKAIYPQLDSASHYAYANVLLCRHLLTIPETPVVVHPTGIRVTGTGTAYYRTPDTLVQLLCPTVHNFDHQMWTWDIRVWHKGEWKVDHPLLYMPAFRDFNSSEVYGFCQPSARRIDRAELTADGFVVEMSAEGEHKTGNVSQPPSFVDAWKRLVSLKGGTMEVADSATSTPPTGLAIFDAVGVPHSVPIAPLAQFWHLPADRVKTTAKVTQDGDLLCLGADAEIVATIQIGAVTPPPPSTDVEVRGVIRTVNGKRELVVPLP